MKNQGNMVAEKENKKFLKTKLKKKEDCHLNDKEFMIAVYKILNEIQENSERQFSELRN